MPTDARVARDGARVATTWPPGTAWRRERPGRPRPRVATDPAAAQRREAADRARREGRAGARVATAAVGGRVATGAENPTAQAQGRRANSRRGPGRAASDRPDRPTGRTRDLTARRAPERPPANAGRVATAGRDSGL